MSTTPTYKKIQALEAKKDQLYTLLEKEKQGTPEWLDIQWDIDALVEEICDLEQDL